MNAKVSIDQVRAVLLDIEGTTTPIDFVHEVLFDYARTHVRDFLTRHFESEDVRADIQLLRQEHAVDVSKKRNPPPLAQPSSPEELDSIVSYVNWLIGRDCKTTGLKSLQGKIWHEGYSDGTLQSQVYSDVAPALARWRVSGLSINIFSSGSVFAQQVLFAHTEVGDLTWFINNYFDTAVGEKGEAVSYRRIAEALGLQPQEIVFISDIVGELAAASEAGMKTLLAIRPGNLPQESPERYQAIETFEDLTIKNAEGVA